MKKNQPACYTPFLQHLFMYYKSCHLLFLTGMLLLINGAVFAQTPGYEQDDMVKIQGITTDAQIDPLPLTQRQTTIQYYDGLGRAVQTIAEQASPLQHDMIQPVAYDNLGRQTTSYMPYADETGTNVTGNYRPNAITTDQPNFYNNSSQYLVPTDAAPYNQAVFENSPLQRLLQAGMTGFGYQPGVMNNRYKTVSYRSNTTADGNIPVWNPDGTYTTGTYYGVNKLSVTDGVDEAGSETLVFTDDAGHTVLKRQKISSNNVDTYYLYNNAGMVNYILPPAAFTIMAGSSNYNANQTGAVSTLVFHFIYDTMGRLTQKTVPAKGTMYIIYDPLNRPVLLQDANLAANNAWNYIRYDARGRAISQGIYTDATRVGYTAMQNYVSGLAASYQSAWYETRNTVLSTGYYTATIFPTTATGTIVPLAYSYFDNYTLTGGVTYAYASQGLPGEETATTAAVKGMATMVRTIPVGSGVPSTTIRINVTFYDRRLHPIQVQSNNQVYNTGNNLVTDYSTAVPDFMGVPQVTQVSKQSSSSVTTTVQSNFTYDQVNRLTAVSQQYDKSGNTIAVAAYSYSEAGQVIKKSLGYVNATTWLQNVDFRYNIRGQLLYINNSTLANDGGKTNSDTNDLFGMAFLYDQAGANSLGNTLCYNGDLSSARWMSKDNSGNATNERAYNYTYDQLNRYTAAAYAERIVANNTFGTNVNAYTETVGYTADNSGNITTLTRKGPVPVGSSTFGTIDQLSYSYSAANPNQLATVVDASSDSLGFYNRTGVSTAYAYDGNGNVVRDYYKGLSMNYNSIARLNKVLVTTGNNEWIDYTYDASGTLMRKSLYNNNTLETTTDYVDGFVYINGTLSYFPMPEGRVTNNAGTLTQEFIITDQQGNARLSFKNNGSGAAVTIQENSFYGTGLAMTPIVSGTNKKLYNGQSEWQNDFNKLPDYYQTFYRNYDAATARFIGVDPSAESAESMTGYQYANNNPIMYNDPAGDIMRLPYQRQTVFTADPYAENIENIDMGGGVGDSGGGMSSEAASLIAQSDYQNALNDYDVSESNHTDPGSAASFGNGLRDEAGLTSSTADMASLFEFRQNNISMGLNALGTGPASSSTMSGGLNIGRLIRDYTGVTINNSVLLPQINITNWDQFLPKLQAELDDYYANQESNSSSWDAINNGISAFGIGNGVKGAMIDYAVTASGGEATSALVTYGKVTDALGVAGGVVAMGSAGYNMYNQYQQNHRISDIHIGDAGDFAVGAASVGATLFLATNPVGWAIGAGAALYFTGRFIYQYEQTH